MESEAPIQAKLVLSSSADEPSVENSRAQRNAVADFGVSSTFSDQALTDGEVLCEAMGITITGAVTRQSRRLVTTEGLVVDPGFHLVVSAYDETKALQMLSRILEPLKIEQAREFETLAQADRELQQESLRRVREQYKSYQRNDNLPKPEDVAYFRQKVARLEDALTPLRIIENAMPGRLALGIRRARRGRLICTYDDLSFSALLKAAHTARGSLDLELLVRSWRGQVFDAAYLEGLEDQPFIAPKVWAIIIARPETVGRFLMSSTPITAGLADACLILAGMVSPGFSRPLEEKIITWQRAVSRLLQSSRTEIAATVRMSDDAYQEMLRFEHRITKALQQDRNARCLGQLTGLVGKIVLSAYTADNKGLASVTKSYVEKAVGFVELSIAQRRSILTAWRDAVSEKEFQTRCRSVLEKIVALGPISAHDLRRKFDDMRSELLWQALSHLLRTDQIIKDRHGRFDIPSRWLSRLQIEVC